MPTQTYVNGAGARQPGVTTVIGGSLGWKGPGLMRWAHAQGIAGRELYAKRDEAAEIGTHVHTMIEEHIHGRDPEATIPWDVYDEDQCAQMRRGFKSFIRWYAGNNISIIATEVWGVDEAWQTGFCPDALGVTNVGEPELCLFDWKTSKGTFADHLIQTAAYIQFVQTVLREGRDFNGGEILDQSALDNWKDPGVKITGCHIVRFGKEHATFKHSFYDTEVMDKAWGAFTHLRHLHAVKKELEALAR